MNGLYDLVFERNFGQQNFEENSPSIRDDRSKHVFNAFYVWNAVREQPKEAIIIQEDVNKWQDFVQFDKRYNKENKRGKSKNI